MKKGECMVGSSRNSIFTTYLKNSFSLQEYIPVSLIQQNKYTYNLLNGFFSDALLMRPLSSAKSSTYFIRIKSYRRNMH